MAISTTVPLNAASAVVGYGIKASLAGLAAGFIPHRIHILGEMASANQAGATKLNFTSAKQVGNEYGFDSPLYAVARILRPLSGDKIGSIPTVCYSVLEAAGATATVITKSITGTATKSTTHSIYLNGRNQIDGSILSYSVEIGDTDAEIAPKMADAINNALGACGTGSVDVSDNFVFTSGWKGASAAECNIEIDVNGDAAGLVYAEVSKTGGTGEPSISDALNEFGSEWGTMVINCLGAGTAGSYLDAIEQFNGNANDGTGRYVSTDFMPFISFFGDNSVATVSAALAITDSRKNEMTNCLCVSPNSTSLSFEAAANVVADYAPILQETPNIDPIGRLYPDLPVASTIDDFATYTNRDMIMKGGCSTVKVNGSAYEIVDLVTTYHPDDEPQTAVLFRYVRDILGLDFNYRYLYKIYEQLYVVGKTIVGDNALTTAPNTISPKQWKAILATQYGPQLVANGLMADIDVFRESLQVGIGESNPNRFETSFIVQRTGTVRVASTTNNTQLKFG